MQHTCSVHLSRGWLLASGLALAVVLAGGAPARAANSLRIELAEAAKKIAEVLRGQNADAVAVGEFTGPRRLRSSAGPGIAEVLTEELKKVKITVKDEANFEVKGDFLDIEDKDSEQLAALLKIRVLDRTGKVVVEMERGIFGDQTLASLFGLTVELPPNAGDKARTQKLKESLEQPRTHLTQTRISAGPGSPYAIEILVKSGDRYVPRAPSDEGGRAFVPIRRHELYAVRFINESPHDAAVTLTIDGINMFAFSEVKNRKTGQPQYTHVIIPAGKSGTILGWHVNNQRSDAFLVGEYAKSPAAQLLQSSAKVGTITATFAAAWPRGGRMPDDEPPSRSGDATVRGPEVAAKFKEVERDIGVVRASISVRYTK